MPRFEVLCVTMHQTDFQKVAEMNIRSNVVFANQCDRTAYEEKEFDGFTAKMISTETRGLARNRNIGLVHSRAEYVLFADDDQIFLDGYEEKVERVLAAHPEADAIKFYCESTNPARPLSYRRPVSFCRASKRKLMSAGVPCLVIKKDFLVRSNVHFLECVGAGTAIFTGEDSIFYHDLLKAKAKIFLSDELISYVKQEGSTWFSGYTEQFYRSVGYVYARIYGALAPAAALRRVILTRRRKDCNSPFFWAYRNAIKGIAMQRRGKTDA